LTIFFTASRVGHLRFTFTDTRAPYVLIEATRASIIGSADVTNITLPQGTISIDPSVREITGSNPERQDFIIDPISTPATKWSGYFCVRFDTDFEGYGVANNGTQQEGEKEGKGSVLSGYVKFGSETKVVNVRVGVSFISVDQARKNLDAEVPDGTSLEETAKKTRTEWAEKLDRVQISGASTAEKQVFYTAFFHTLQVGNPYYLRVIFFLVLTNCRQYPYEQDEDGKYYSGYDDAVHDGNSYTGYSIWVSLFYAIF
jgi:putative alpha-1,2-mannosidase